MEEGDARCRFLSTQVDTRLKTKAYRKWLRPFAEVRFSDQASVHSSIAACSVHDLTLALLKSSPAHYARTSQTVTHSKASGCVLVQLILQGTLYADFGQESADLARGDVFFADMAATCDAWMDDCESLHLIIPRNYLHNVARVVHGRMIRRDSLDGRMLRDHLARCAAVLRAKDVDGVVHMAHAAVDLVLQCLSDGHGVTGDDDFPQESKQVILEYIEQNLGSQGLNADQLSTQFAVSRAKLYRLFAEFGGVQHFIRDRRLDAVLRDLCKQSDLSIAEAARRYGFSNDRQFQRAFRARFGVTARDARTGWRLDQFSQQYRS
jgi:AraC-like DNA-binding protein